MALKHTEGLDYSMTASEPREGSPSAAEGTIHPDPQPIAGLGPEASMAADGSVCSEAT